ncbi:hypothetical protein [Solibacillus sp. FSL W7-1324]|uniref:hypothetical protein n=1 Tax=Solibacillus sp. FSL W7-1324 TaxID=2921701 RepID=UPI0030FC6D48
MRLHHSSTLTVEYFLRYAQLVMNSRELSVEETQQFMEDFFFKGEPLVYGESTRQQFLQAMAELLKY